MSGDWTRLTPSRKGIRIERDFSFLIDRRSIWSLVGMLLIASFLTFLPHSGRADALQQTQKLRILVMGDSIAAGYGLDTSEAFPARMQQIADQNSLPIVVVNAGLSGETSAGGLRRIDWLLKQPIDIFVLELGGNDALRGLPVDDTERNLEAIIHRVRERYPSVDIVLAGMKAPPNLGADFTARFERVYQNIAARTNLTLVPFVLEGVGGITSLNQADGIHPTAQGQQIVAQTVWKQLEPLIRARLASSQQAAHR